MCAYASGNEYFHIGMPIIDPPVRYCHNYISLSSFSHVIQYTILHSYAALSVDSASWNQTTKLYGPDYQEDKSLVCPLIVALLFNLVSENIHLISCVQ
jgi:hypothetical protein